ncbi:MAG: hypothetical protein PVG92_07940 [Holophagae bacterium]
MRYHQARTALLTLLLTGGIVVEGLVSALPHDHAPEVPPQPVLCENHDCAAPTSVHWRQQAPVDAASCLACSVPSIVFQGAPANREPTALFACLAPPTGHRVIDSNTRRWQPRLRAPPQLT